MRAILIDAKNMEIREVEIDGSLESLQKAVGGLIETAMYLENGDVMFVNEDGLALFDYFFEITGGHQPFAGNGIVVGDDGNGGERSCNSTVEGIELKVWYPCLGKLRERYSSEK